MQARLATCFIILKYLNTKGVIEYTVNDISVLIFGYFINYRFNGISVIALIAFYVLLYINWSVKPGAPAGTCLVS